MLKSDTLHSAASHQAQQVDAAHTLLLLKSGPTEPVAKTLREMLERCVPLFFLLSHAP